MKYNSSKKLLILLACGISIECSAAEGLLDLDKDENRSGFENKIPPPVTKEQNEESLGYAKTFLKWSIKKIGEAYINYSRSLPALVFSNNPQKAELVLWNDIWSVVKVPPSLNDDFSRYRSPPYTPLAVQAWKSYVDKLFSTHPEKVFLPTDEQIKLVMHYSTLGFYTSEAGGKRILDMSLLNHQKLFYGHYNITQVEYDTKKDELNFISKFGQRYTPQDKNMYDLAKFDFICSSAAFIPSVGHSWVHFHFPDIVSALVHNMPEKESPLYKLLDPHVRFTTALDDSVLRSMPIPDNNSDNFRGKYLSPTSPFPITLDNFLFSNSRRVVDFYKEGGEFHCPPKFPDVPYCNILMEYYGVIREFIDDIKYYLEPELGTKHSPGFFIKEMSHYLPQVAKFEPVDVVATFIWQAAIVHSTDHHSMYKGYRNTPKGCDDGLTALVSGPVSPTVITKDLRECNATTKIEDIADQLYLDRFRNFIDLFVKYIPDELGLTMDRINYNFGIKELDDKAASFQKKLLAKENELKKRKNIFGGKSSLLCPLHEMPQSICF